MVCRSNVVLPFVFRIAKIRKSSDITLFPNNENYIISSEGILYVNAYLHSSFTCLFNALTFNQDTNIQVQLVTASMNPYASNMYINQLFFTPIFSQFNTKMFENKLDTYFKFNTDVDITIDNNYDNPLLYFHIQFS